MTESFREFLDRSKRSAVAVFHRFRLEVSGGLTEALFLEGFDDQLFYCRFLPIGVYSHSSVRLSFGKRNMDKIFEWFYAEGLDERCNAIFVRDADFDEYLGNLPAGAAVRILDRYSVENFVFLKENLERLVLERFGLSPEEYDVNGFLQRYEEGVRNIFKHLAPLLGAALAASQDGQSVNLDGLRVREVAKKYFSDGKLPEILDAHFDACKIGEEYRTDESAQIGTDFVQRDAFLWMRGHYLADISSAYVQLSHDRIRDLKTAGVIHSINPNMSVDFSPSALFERLASFCSCPAILQALA